MVYWNLELLGNDFYTRQSHSTATAMLEIQSSLADSIDKGLYTSIYSVDMSAAFDLLRIAVFNKSMKD